MGRSAGGRAGCDRTIRPRADTEPMTWGTPAIAFTRSAGWPPRPRGTDGFRRAGEAATIPQVPGWSRRAPGRPAPYGKARTSRSAPRSDASTTGHLATASPRNAAPSRSDQAPRAIRPGGFLVCLPTAAWGTAVSGCSALDDMLSAGGRGADCPILHGFGTSSRCDLRSRPQ